MQTYTFWQLANQYKIEIPIIQRDYAQGRKDKKSEEIREKFLDDLLAHLQNRNPVELDFVYGKIQDGVFIPIDGQQRLTTLFLLHWYIAIRTDSRDAFKNISFTYKTRISARDFCERLIEEEFRLCCKDDLDYKKYIQTKLKKDKLSDEDNECFRISYSIRNSSWFFLSWKKDPTVQAMLTMLDSIHEKFKEEDLNTFWKVLKTENYTLPTNNEKLNELVEVIQEKGNNEVKDKLKEVQEKPIISFKFLNLDEFELTDDLYLKMNARGKALTPFENFKSRFEKHIKENGWEKQETFAHKIDTVWTDLFWKHRGEGFNVIDYEIINFIAGIAINNYALKGDEKKVKELHDAPIKIRVEDFSDKEHFEYLRKSLDLYADKDLGFNSIKIESVPLWNYTNDNSLFVEFIKDKNKGESEKYEGPTYPQRILFFAQTHFLLDNPDIGNTFYDWMRFIRNIVENTTIDSYDKFVSAVKAIDKLLPCKNDILKNLKEGKCDETPFFGTQIKEEKLKAQLILNDSGFDWKTPIIEAENHLMFKGNIGFLLPEKENSDLEKFISRKEVAETLFNKDSVTVGKDNNLLGRTLLAIGLDLKNNELWLGGKKNQYWKDHLKDNHYIPYIGRIIDNLITLEKEDFESKLKEIIKENYISYSQDFWKRNLIETPGLFSSYSFYGRIIKNWRGINLYEQEKFNEKTNAILIENNRNEIIRKFLEIGFVLKKGSPRINNTFFAGDNIEISKNIRESNKIYLIFKKEEFTIKDKETIVKYIETEKIQKLITST